jgi:hypothetical protein
MAIHHSQIKKAEKAGYTLDDENDVFTAFWPMRALRITGSSVSDAMAQMQAAMALLGVDGTRIVPDTETPRLVYVRRDDKELKGCPMTPVEAHLITTKGNDEWEAPNEADATKIDDIVSQLPVPKEPKSPKSEPAAPVARSENGVALDGGVAYREGTPAGDNPFTTETDDDEEYARASKWDEEWDAAADEAQEEEGGKGGSVVNEKYRAKYIEEGHPNTCGDWLATILDNLCKGKKDTDLERFETICAMNGVDTSKYKRSGVGWQGRIRMTGRNLLAKRVFAADGVLHAPDMEGDGAVEYKAPADWMAAQRFKSVKKAA